MFVMKWLKPRGSKSCKNLQKKIDLADPFDPSGTITMPGRISWKASLSMAKKSVQKYRRNVLKHANSRSQIPYWKGKK